MPGEIRQGLGQILSDCQIQNHTLHLLNGVPVKKTGTLHENICSYGNFLKEKNKLAVKGS